jgi:general stress protein 26
MAAEEETMAEQSTRPPAAAVTFDAIRGEFEARVRRIVWCTVATVDARGRPRTRILHPVWEDTTGWIATGRHTLKTRHLDRTPYVSLTYWDPQHQQVYVEARTAWEDRPAEKQRLWELFKSLPAPYGYDLKLIWPSVEDPSLGFLKLIPWRIELWGLQDMMTGKQPQVWRAG